IGKNYLLLVLAVAAGAAMANSLVPPTPGPLFLASEMNIPIGLMMVGGILVGIVTVVAGYLYAVWANKRWPIPLRDSIDAPLKNIKSLSAQGDHHLPALSFSLLPILIPLVFITARAGLNAYGVEASSSAFLNALIRSIHYLGEK